MFQVLGFLLNYITEFMKMLFTIQVDRNLSLGLLFCICFIFLPMVHRVVCFIKQDAMEELDDEYDHSKPRFIDRYTDTDIHTQNFGDGFSRTTHHTTGYLRSTRSRRRYNRWN